MTAWSHRAHQHRHSPQSRTGRACRPDPLSLLAAGEKELIQPWPARQSHGCQGGVGGCRGQGQSDQCVATSATSCPVAGTMGKTSVGKGLHGALPAATHPQRRHPAHPCTGEELRLVCRARGPDRLRREGFGTYSISSTTGKMWKEKTGDKRALCPRALSKVL